MQCGSPGRTSRDLVELARADAEHLQRALKALVGAVPGKTGGHEAGACEELAAREPRVHRTCTVAHTPRSSAATWSGLGPTGIVATTCPNFGSTCETVPSL
jgi:hypothetical protein